MAVEKRATPKWGCAFLAFGSWRRAQRIEIALVLLAFFEELHRRECIVVDHLLRAATRVEPVRYQQCEFMYAVVVKCTACAFTTCEPAAEPVGREPARRSSPVAK